MSSHDTWLRRIVAQNSTLEEHLGAERSFGAEDKAGQRLTAWRKRVAEDDPERFARRLAWDGLSEESVRQSLGPVSRREDAALPVWAETLRACAPLFDAPSTAPDRVRAEGRRYLAPGEPLPFEEALVPFLDHASQTRPAEPEGCPPLSGPAWASAEQALLRELSWLCGRTLGHEFSFYRACHAPGTFMALMNGEEPRGQTLYTSFLQELHTGGLVELLKEYAVLARLIALCMDRWRDSIAECLQRLARDLPALRETLLRGEETGALMGFDMGLSDPHGGGRRVFRLSFASGCSLIYKPRSLGLEAAWSKLLDWCNQAGGTPSLRAAGVLDRQTHGWMEYVRPSPCESPTELKHHHQRAGMQLALLYVLGGTDFHQENLLAVGAHPVLIDHEMLLSPLLRPLAGGKDGPPPTHSVLRTGLLPTASGSPEEERIETSGLGGQGGVLTSHQRLVWKHLNTDGMQLVSEPWLTRGRNNIPHLEGKPCPASEHLEPVLHGFHSMYLFLAENREALLAPDGPLERLRGQPVRILLRSTQSYGWLLEHLLDPDMLREGIDRSLELDVLSRAFLWEEQPHPAWPAVREEAAALDRLDIPRFTGRTEGTEVILESGKHLQGLAVISGLELARATLRSMGTEDLKLQRQLITSALAPPSGPARSA